MKIVLFDKIKKLSISPLNCYEWVSDASVLKKKAILPTKINLKSEKESVFYNTMPVIIPS